jgi:hypothetical protein
VDSDVFNRVVDNIRLLTRAKSKLNSKTTIGGGCLTCNYTVLEMYDMTIFYKGLRVDYFQFRPMQMHNNGKFEYHRSVNIKR